MDTRVIPDVPVEAVRGISPTDPVGAGTAPFPCITKLINEGAPQGCRDDAMYHFARYALGTGMSIAIAIEWCQEVNEKFSPPLRVDEVVQKVHSASLAAKGPNCNAPFLDGFCPGGGRCPKTLAPKVTKGFSTAAFDTARDYIAMNDEERRAERNR